MKKTALALFILALCPFILGAQIIYVVNSSSRTLSRIDPELETANNSFAQLGNIPNKVLVSDEYLWVVCSGDNSLQKISASNGQLLATHYVAVGSNPWDAILYDGYIYVTGLFTFKVYKMDATTGQVVSSVSVGAAPEAMAVLNNKLYVCNAGNYVENYEGSSVSVVDLASFSVIKTITVGKNPQFIKAYNDMLYVSSTGNWTDVAGDLSVIDPQTDEVVHTISLGGTPGNFWINDSGIAYVADGNGYCLFSFNANDFSILNGLNNPLNYLASDIAGSDDFIAIINPNWEGNANVQLLHTDLSNWKSYSVGMMPSDIKIHGGSTAIADESITPPVALVKVYPSPLSSGAAMNIKALTGNSGEFRLYNARGQLVYKTRLQQGEHKSLSVDLPGGVYFYRFIGAKSQDTGKLVIIR